MKLKFLAVWLVVGFAVSACGGGSSESGSDSGAVSGIQMPERVEVIPD